MFSKLSREETILLSGSHQSQVVGTDKYAVDFCCRSRDKNQIAQGLDMVKTYGWEMQIVVQTKPKTKPK